MGAEPIDRCHTQRPAQGALDVSTLASRLSGAGSSSFAGASRRPNPPPLLIKLLGSQDTPVATSVEGRIWAIDVHRYTCGGEHWCDVGLSAVELLGTHVR